jgi:hypothetical protein
MLKVIGSGEIRNALKSGVQIRKIEKTLGKKGVQS